MEPGGQQRQFKTSVQLKAYYTENNNTPTISTHTTRSSHHRLSILTTLCVLWVRTGAGQSSVWNKCRKIWPSSSAVTELFAMWSFEQLTCNPRVPWPTTWWCHVHSTFHEHIAQLQHFTTIKWQTIFSFYFQRTACYLIAIQCCKQSWQWIIGEMCRQIWRGCSGRGSRPVTNWPIYCH